MNIYRFNYFIADYLDDLVKRTGDWNKADEIAESVYQQLHSLINSGIAQNELFEEGE